MTTNLLLPDLARDEGLRLHAYQDTKGVWTIGFGHTGREVHPGLVWTRPQAVSALMDDVGRVKTGLDTAIPWWTGLCDVRQDVLAELAFNVGFRGNQDGMP